MISGVRDSSGAITHYVGIQEDVTSRKIAQEALLQSEKLASVGTLSAGVVHEILNPLNTISTVTQMLRMEEQREEVQTDLDEILNQVRRATKITNNLRMFARPKKAEISRFDLHRLFDNVSSLTERDLNLENIRIERDYDPDLPPASGDEDQLAQVFLNLLNNARDAMVGKKGDWIRIKTRLEGETILIEFSDNGTGIPRDIVAKIFDPFFTTKDPGKGTGLGLSLVHSIIESHGGSISVESAPGAGTTFIIRFPVPGSGITTQPPRQKSETSSG